MKKKKVPRMRVFEAFAPGTSFFRLGFRVEDRLAVLVARVTGMSIWLVGVFVKTQWDMWDASFCE